MYRSPTQLRATIQRAAPLLLVLLAAVIIVLGRADERMFAPLRIALADDTGPVLGALSRPLVLAATAVDRVRGVVEMYQDNLRLESDNARLLQWQQAALRLAEQNRELRQLLRVVPNPALSYVTARVIADSGGGYVRTALIDAGSKEGLARGQAVIAGQGLVGRLTEVGERAARVLLITDLNSRIPVIVDGAPAAAVLAGDNSERPRLMYAVPPDRIKIGERVVTSGEGGLFPPDLPVGVVSALDPEGARVEPFVGLSQLGYVMVVNYGLARDLPQPVPASAGHRRHARPTALAAAVR